MKGGSNLDYGKVCDILGYIYDEADDLISFEYLPAEFWEQFEDTLFLCALVSANWAEPTGVGKTNIDIAWNLLCQARELDPAVMYDSPIEFFKAQAEDAEVIPISQGIKK